MTRSGFAAALLASVAIAPANADERAAVEAQIEALQARVGALEARRARARVTAAAAVERGSKPRSWKLPGTNTSMQLGGYAKLDIIYDLNASSGDTLGITGLPIDGSAAGNRQGNFRIHARQSRLWIKTWTPTDWGGMATVIEADFFGGGGNQLVSNSNSFRIRKAYGRLGPVLAGQDFSTFYLGPAVGPTIDFNGPSGQVFIRQALIRYTHSFGGGTSLDIAVENPETGFVISPGGLAVAGALGPSLDSLPDIGIKLSHRFSKGYVALAGLFRRLNVNDGGAAGLSSSTFGWGVHFGGVLRFNNNRTRIGGTVVGGEGLGRYVKQGRTSAILNGTSSVGQSLSAVSSIAGQIWIEHRWTDTIRTTVIYGRAFTDQAAANTTGVGGKTGLGALVQDVQSVHANMLWNPTPKVEIGLEYMYGFNGVINSANATAHRIQIGFKYSF